MQYKGRREKGKSWAKEPVLGLDQLTVQSLQITLSLPLHSQRATYLYVPSLFFYREKKLNKTSNFPAFHKPFAYEGRGCKRTKTTRERSKVGAKVRAGNNQNPPPCFPQPRNDTDHRSPSSVPAHTRLPLAQGCPGTEPGHGRVRNKSKWAPKVGNGLSCAPHPKENKSIKSPRSPAAPALCLQPGSCPAEPSAAGQRRRAEPAGAAHGRHGGKRAEKAAAAEGREGREGKRLSYLLRAGALAASSSACWAPAGAGGGGQPGRGGGKSCLSPRDPVSCSSFGARAGSGIYFLLLCIHDAE